MISILFLLFIACQCVLCRLNDGIGVYNDLRKNAEISNTQVPSRIFRRDIPQIYDFVTELTDDNFDKHVSSGKHFVNFYDGSNPRSKHFAPYWKLFTRSLGNDHDISFSQISCEMYHPFCLKHGVDEAPTLRWIANGKNFEKYNGSRYINTMTEYINKMSCESEIKNGSIPTANSIFTLTYDNIFREIKSGIVFVKFSALRCGENIIPTWEALSNKFASNSLVRIANADCTEGTNMFFCQQIKINNYPSLVLFENGGKLRRYNGPRTLTDLYEFVMKRVAAIDDK